LRSKNPQLQWFEATERAPPSLHGGFGCRVRQLCAVWQYSRPMRGARSVAKFQCGEALAADGRFGQAQNINAMRESCGKLEATGFAKNVLRQNQGSEFW
jgi:hypothetical protein